MKFKNQLFTNQKKIQAYEKTFDQYQFANDAQQIFIGAHEALCKYRTFFF